MRTIRRTLALVLALAALFSACAPAAAATKKNSNYQINDKNKATFTELLDRLKTAYEAPAEDDSEQIDTLVEKIAGVNADDGDVARAVAEHWKAVYLDPGYRLCVWWGKEKANELVATKPDYDEKHAFVVLGFQLKNGKITEELKGRCNAAAAAARSFPDAYLICSGGATGSNNPDNNTEAGVMKQYLVKKCGIDKKRILTDTRALTTLANAENTFAILRKRDIHSITIVTSTYHQKWGQVLYNAMAALYEKRYDFKVRIVGNYCFDIEPETENLRNGYRIAISQLTDMLKLKKVKK